MYWLLRFTARNTYLGRLLNLIELLLEWVSLYSALKILTYAYAMVIPWVKTITWEESEAYRIALTAFQDALLHRTAWATLATGLFRITLK